MTLHRTVAAMGYRRQLHDRQQRIYNFLTEQRLGVLSTVTPDNDPHGTVVYYHVGSNFTISILTKKGTRKYDNLTHNNHVMLTVFEPRHQITLQVIGTAVERSSANTIARITGAIFGDTLQTTTVGLPPIVKLQAGAFTTFQISPRHIRMAYYARPESGSYEDLFDSIESFEFTPR